MDAIEILALCGFLAASFVAASPGAIFSPGEWYERLIKPSWRPPNWLFGPVWTVLYVVIAISGWLVWRETGFDGTTIPLAVFAVQLLLNAAWTPIFFGIHQPGWAFLEIIILWWSICATIVLFYPIHGAAAWLLIPYLFWVTFAAALNFAVWRLNSQRDLNS
jgi:translocator protein